MDDESMVMLNATDKLGTIGPSTAVNMSTSSHRGASEHTLSASWWRSWQRLNSLKTSICYLWIVLSLLISKANGMSLGHEHMPTTIITTDELESQNFHGNHSHVDYFRLLQRDGDALLIGARNIVFNISIYDLSENYDQRIVWHSSQRESDTCFSKGRSETDCQNYIRVLAKKSEGEFLVCGTNAYKPLCRDYSLQSQNNSFTYVETSGTGKCPYNPRHNSTFVYVDGHLYSGTVADFQEMVPIIFRSPTRTEPANYHQLNAPSFVHSFSYGEYVFFFFREIAAEYTNCGKSVYSRVARVCKEDLGVEQKIDIFWTTFLKSRLNCSFPGDFPFFFDEIQSVTDVIRGRYQGTEHEIIYGVFNTPENSIHGSAVCAFSMRDILDAFEGPFKEQADMNSNWLPVPPHRVPEPRPGSCTNNSRELPNEVSFFARTHPLMDDMVPTFFGQPLLIKSSHKYRFTKLAVDSQVPLVDGSTVDIIYVATDAGILFKAMNRYTSSEDVHQGPIIIEELRPFKVPLAINNLQIAKLSTGITKLIVITDSDVIGIPVHRCHRAFTCSECIGLQDPYCGWHKKKHTCVPIQNFESDFIYQNVSSGFHKQCPVEKITESSTLYNRQTEPTPTPVETCPPCVCPEQSTLPPDDKLTPETTNPLQGISESPIENEIESRQRSLDLNDDFIINQILPPSRPKPQKRPIMIEEAETVQEISIAYSEGDPTVTGPLVGETVGQRSIYSGETMAIAVTIAIVCALVFGFVSGYHAARKCAKKEERFSEPFGNLTQKFNKCDNMGADPNMYTANNTPKQINNLMPNYNPKDINNRKSNADNTLVKPAKCAYI